MSYESETAPVREILRRQVADDHGFTLYRHYSERDAAAFLRLHPVTLKKSGWPERSAISPRAAAPSPISGSRSPITSSIRSDHAALH
jgi:hypothetical protein